MQAGVKAGLCFAASVNAAADTALEHPGMHLEQAPAPHHQQAAHPELQSVAGMDAVAALVAEHHEPRRSSALEPEQGVRKFEALLNKTSQQQLRQWIKACTGEQEADECPSAVLTSVETGFGLTELLQEVDRKVCEAATAASGMVLSALATSIIQ